VNNFVCGAQVAALAEAIALMERSGLRIDQAFPVLLEGAPGSPLVKVVAQRMVARDPTVNFSVALMKKDLDYAMAVGDRLGMPLTTAATARQAFQRAVDYGLAGADIWAIVEPLRR
jgi:3-hydroxyisobutyrate dehydrogenase